MNGVPQSVRLSCAQKYHTNPDRKERWNELSFSDYSDIIKMNTENWQLFCDHYNFSGVQKRSEALSWLGRLTRFRNTTVHGSRARGSPLGRADIEFINRIYQLVTRHIKGREKLNTRHNYLSSVSDTRSGSADRTTATDAGPPHRLSKIR
jgi:hypothetical protein